MKRLIFLTITVLIYGCVNNFLIDHKTKNVQACFNLLYKDKENKPLEKCKLIIVKDAFSSDLGKLHFGKNNILLEDVEPKKIKTYYLPSDDTNKVYIKIKYIPVKNKTTINIEFPSGNSMFIFYLIQNGSDWKIDHATSIVR